MLDIGAIYTQPQYRNKKGIERKGGRKGAIFRNPRGRGVRVSDAIPKHLRVQTVIIGTPGHWFSTSPCGLVVCTISRSCQRVNVDTKT